MSQQTTSSQKIVWSETIRRLGLNIASCISDGVFTCPVFGTPHQIPYATRNISDRPLRIIPYGGYEYYLKDVYDTTRKTTCFVFGLLTRDSKGRASILKPIMLISKDISDYTLYDTMGKQVGVYRVEV